MADFLLLAFIFLVAGVIAVPIASRFGLGSVLGYLIAGILISPTLNFLGVDVVAVQHFAEFGVVMMLFLVGLELEPKLLWEMRGRLFGLGGGQVFGTALIIMALALFLGQTWQVSVAIGLVLALSSTAIVLQSLNEKGLMRSDGGQASFSVLLFQDIAVIPMLALLPLLAVPELMGATEAGHDSGLSLIADLNSWQTALVTLGAIAFVVFGGNYLTRPIFRFIAAARLRELFTAAALMMIIGIALLMTLVGLSPALGTFLAGVVLANSEYRHELESDIEPFKGLLLGLFFMTVGAGINFALLTENAGPIIGLTLALIAIKILVLLMLGSLFKIPGAHRWLFALSLAQAGEFGFVLLAFTVANGILPDVIADKLLLVVAMSMLLTPLLFIFYDRVIAPLYNREQEREADHIPDASPIIIAGRGRVGGIVDRILESAGYKSTVIDFSSVQLGRLQKFGINAYFGDATRPDLLRSAGIDEAKMLIVAIDGKEQITKLVKYAVQTYPDLHVIARAVDRDHVYELWSVGCRDIIRESYDSSVRMGRSAFEAIGISRETADRMVRVFQDADRRSMIEFADVYDIDIPSYENEALIAKARQLQDEWEPELREQIIAIMNGQNAPD
jgi:CPA2 family monovalent cation:H+ antiporter-2